MIEKEQQLAGSKAELAAAKQLADKAEARVAEAQSAVAKERKTRAAREKEQDAVISKLRAELGSISDKVRDCARQPACTTSVAADLRRRRPMSADNDQQQRPATAGNSSRQ